MKLGKRIRLAREHAQIGQTALARLMHIDRTTLAGYEADRISVPLDKLELIARNVSKPMAWFFLEEGYRLERDVDTNEHTHQLVEWLGSIISRTQDFEAELKSQRADLMASQLGMTAPALPRTDEQSAIHTEDK